MPVRPSVTRPRDPHLLALLIAALACSSSDGDDTGTGDTASTGTGEGGSVTGDDGSDGNMTSGETDNTESGGTSDATGSDADTSGDDGGTSTGETTSSTGEPVDPPPYTPVHRLDVRVHRGDSDLSDQELTDIFSEMNLIWRSQAGVCFEFEAVTHENIRQGGFDMWFIRNSDPRVSGFNGVYRGDHDILSRDDPGLSNVNDPVMFNAARTAAHELGHGLSLNHTNDAGTWGSEHRENLMASGTKGWHIPVEPADPRDQVLAARSRAQQKALPDAGELICAPPRFE